MEPRSEAIRGAVRSPAYERVSHGLYLPRKAALPTRVALLRGLQAYTLVLPPDAGFTHISAAQVRGWSLPRLPVLPPVFAAGKSHHQPRRAGLVYSRLRGLAEPERVAGVPLVSSAEALLRSARDLGTLDLVVMLDSALRSGGCDTADLEFIASSSRPGARRLRVALSWSDARAESPFETLLRLFHEFAGIEVEPQFPVLDTDGRLLARADLRVKGTPLLHEYDGAGHAQQAQRAWDLRRQRRLTGSSYVRQGFVAEDLLLYPLATLQEIDRAVGRTHHPGRIARWKREVELSSYSVQGRQRLLNRWLAYPGFNDCAKAA